MNVPEASVTKEVAVSTGHCFSHGGRASAHKCSALEGELEISLYPRQNRLSSHLEASRGTGERGLEVIGRGDLAFAASRPSLSSLLKEHRPLDHKPVWKDLLACLSPVPPMS